MFGIISFAAFLSVDSSSPLAAPAGAKVLLGESRGFEPFSACFLAVFGPYRTPPDLCASRHQPINMIRDCCHRRDAPCHRPVSAPCPVKSLETLSY